MKTELTTTQLKRHQARCSMDGRGLELGNLQSSQSRRLMERVAREEGDVFVVDRVKLSQLLHVALGRLDVPHCWTFKIMLSLCHKTLTQTSLEINKKLQLRLWCLLMHLVSDGSYTLVHDENLSKPKLCLKINLATASSLDPSPPRMPSESLRVLGHVRTHSGR